MFFFRCCSSPTEMPLSSDALHELKLGTFKTACSLQYQLKNINLKEKSKFQIKQINALVKQANVCLAQTMVTSGKLKNISLIKVGNLSVKTLLNLHMRMKKIQEGLYQNGCALRASLAEEERLFSTMETLKTKFYKLLDDFKVNKSSILEPKQREIRNFFRTTANLFEYVQEKSVISRSVITKIKESRVALLQRNANEAIKRIARYSREVVPHPETPLATSPPIVDPSSLTVSHSHPLTHLLVPIAGTPPFSARSTDRLDSSPPPLSPPTYECSFLPGFFGGNIHDLSTVKKTEDDQMPHTVVVDDAEGSPAQSNRIEGNVKPPATTFIHEGAFLPASSPSSSVTKLTFAPGESPKGSQQSKNYFASFPVGRSHDSQASSGPSSVSDHSFPIATYAKKSRFRTSKKILSRDQFSAEVDNGSGLPEHRTSHETPSPPPSPSTSPRPSFYEEHHFPR